MSSVRTRKPLAQLVSQACETGFPCSHSAGVIKVTLRCEHGHGNGDEWEPTPACTACWQHLTSFIERNDPLSCAWCEHWCALDVTADWMDGRSITLHFPRRPTPEGMQWMPLSQEPPS